MIRIIIGAVVFSGALSAQAQVQRLQLTQTPCQFVEAEGQDHQYTSQSATDCEAINARTQDDRLKASKIIHLKPGKTVITVTNQNVPYELGFWLRGKGLARVTLPSVSGGGLGTGQSRDYEIDLKPGTYVYSCPLNPTPDYTLVVE